MQVRVKQTQGEKSAAGKKKEYRVSESDISESLEEGAKDGSFENFTFTSE